MRNIKNTIYLIVFFAISCATKTYGQTITPAGTPLSFTDTIVANDSAATKDQLYTKLLLWVGKTYNSAKSVIDLQDKEAGAIIVKGAIPYTVSFLINSSTAYLNYSLIISIKQGRVRLQFSNYVSKTQYCDVIITDADKFKLGGYPGISKPAFYSGQKLAKADHESTITSIKDAIDKPSDNW